MTRILLVEIRTHFRTIKRTIRTKYRMRILGLVGGVWIGGG
jgi:hypothetical protein